MIAKALFIFSSLIPGIVGIDHQRDLAVKRGHTHTHPYCKYMEARKKHAFIFAKVMKMILKSGCQMQFCRHDFYHRAFFHGDKSHCKLSNIQSIIPVGHTVQNVCRLCDCMLSSLAATNNQGNHVG